MKTAELISMSLIAMATMVHLVPSSITRPATSALQAPQVDHEEQSAETPTPRNVFVNVRVFFEMHWRAKQIKRDFDRALAPNKPRVTKLQTEIGGLQHQLCGTDLSPRDAARCQRTISEHRREIEDIFIELEYSFGKGREEITKIVWKDLDHGIKAMTEAYDLKTVVRVDEPDDFWSYSIFQKRPSMRLYIDDRDLAPPGFVDITEHVLSTVTPVCCFPQQRDAEEGSK